MKIKCAICKGPVRGFGHNPEPLASGRCCDVCNDLAVIPARIAAIAGAGKKRDRKKK